MDFFVFLQGEMTQTSHYLTVTQKRQKQNSIFGIKFLVLAHINVCSLRNKVHEITRIRFPGGVCTERNTLAQYCWWFRDACRKRFRLYRKRSGLLRWQSSILIFRKTFKLNYGKISMLILNLQQPIHRPYWEIVVVGCRYRQHSSNACR